MEEQTRNSFLLCGRFTSMFSLPHAPAARSQETKHVPEPWGTCADWAMCPNGRQPRKPDSGSLSEGTVSPDDGTHGCSDSCPRAFRSESPVPSTHAPIAVRMSSLAQEGDSPVYIFPSRSLRCPCLPSTFSGSFPKEGGEGEHGA